MGKSARTGYTGPRPRRPRPRRLTMSRLLVPALALALLAAPRAARGDTFDRYTNDVLAKAPGAPGVQKVERLTPALLAEHAGAVPGVGGAFLVVKTNDGRFGK